MRIVDQKKPASEAKLAKTAWIAAACVLVAGVGASQGVAQNQSANQRTGVAKAEPVNLNSPDDSTYQTAPAPDAAAPVAKPSAAIPATSTTVYGPYVPYSGATTTSATPSATATAPAFDPDANIVTEKTVQRRPLDSTANSADLDAGIVTHVPWLPNEIPDGALLKASLRETISTETTRPGTPFSAELTEPVIGEGRVYIPAGSTLAGRVTWTHAGSRISGGAAIHLEARSITFPDGTEYPLRARVIDTSSWDNTKVDSEGTITRREHTKKNLATVGLATGGGAAAGAIIGGVPGALIGAGIGAGVSTVVWLKQDRQAVLPKDLGVVFSLTTPMPMTPSRAAASPTAPTIPGGE